MAEIEGAHSQLVFFFGACHDDVEALRAEGLEVEWSGDVKTRILVKNLEWHRRRDFVGWSKA